VHSRELLEIEALGLSKAAGLTALEKPRRKQGIAIGFDVEWDVQAADHPLLSAQFSAIVGAERRTRVYDPPAARLTSEAFIALVTRFVTEAGVELPPGRKPVHIVLIAHFAQAELSMFEDPIRDWRIQQVNKAHHAKLTREWRDLTGRRWTFSIVDLFAFFATSLGEVGRSIGLPKLDVDVERLATLKRRNRQEYDAYAGRDAEIAVEAFVRLRVDMLSNYNVDPLVHPTMAALAIAILRHKFLKRRPVPSVQVPNPRREGTMRLVTERFGLIRRLALRAYWGGRCEAFAYGLYAGPVDEWDVISMYPYAALGQPLPDSSTRWWKVQTVEGIEGLEGFALVDFEFPKDCKYPCLPVSHRERLVFPRAGWSACTFIELKVALGMGARLRIREAYGFRPRPEDTDHEVAAFMRHFLQLKAASPKGSIAYNTNKLVLNALVGKFAERAQPDMVVELEHRARQSGSPGVGAVVARSALLRDAIRGVPRPGSGWAPEWAALILGRARALIADLIAHTEPLLVSTDAVIVSAGTPLDCPALRQLQFLGSDLEQKCSGHALFVARARLYAVLQRPPLGGVRTLEERGKALAFDDSWEVVKIARHAIPGDDDEAAADVLACLREGRDVAEDRKPSRLLSVRSAVRKGRPVNDEFSDEKPRRAHFRWDHKRCLRDRDVNPFKGCSLTFPYAATHRMAASDGVRRRLARKRRGGRRKLSQARLAEVFTLFTSGGLSIREIAKRTGIPRSTVQDLHKAFVGDKGPLLDRYAPDQPSQQDHSIASRDDAPGSPPSAPTSQPATAANISGDASEVPSR
jgi:hypothetical protein